MSDEDFLHGKGLSNEVNIRMFTYDPQDEMEVRYFIEQLKSDTHLKCNIKEYNLYSIFLGICEDKKLLHKIPDMEAKKGSDFLLSKILKFSTTKAFIDKMQDEDRQHGDVIFLTGVGEVFPFMRVHSLLEEMQVAFDDVPIIVMYPGEFNGREVVLFNEFKANEYYRAFNLI
ncbi:DUF1788 domain-containing protein [Ligilactobacillus ceti]|nr:DUF1788 domain-containing protein [Ligilactobacillus ceti]